MAYTQSPLATAHVATKKMNVRNQKISKITIHHMAMISTAVDCATMHATTSQQASANYYVGNAGDICSSVPEGYRAWTSGSAWNDQRAITIEVSNDMIGGNWHVSDKALAATIALCIDICKRNGITKVYFDGTKNAPLTLHKFYQNTACPADYIVSLFKSGYMAQQINAGITGVAPTNSTNPSSTTSNSTTAKNPYTAPATIVKYGSKGNTVGWVQWQLCKIFGYNILIDGIYADTTAAAVIDFQKRNKITQNKDCTTATIKALANINSIGANGIKKISLVYNGIDYTPVFDAQYYADNWADLKAAFGYDSAKLFNHYVTCGFKEYRQASAEFNVQKYASRYEDLRKAFGPLSPNTSAKYINHYIQNGKKEGRIAV